MRQDERGPFFLLSPPRQVPSTHRQRSLAWVLLRTSRLSRMLRYDCRSLARYLSIHPPSSSDFRIRQNWFRICYMFWSNFASSQGYTSAPGLLDQPHLVFPRPSLVAAHHDTMQEVEAVGACKAECERGRTPHDHSSISLDLCCFVGFCSVRTSQLPCVELLLLLVGPHQHHGVASLPPKLDHPIKLPQMFLTLRGFLGTMASLEDPVEKTLPASARTPGSEFQPPLHLVTHQERIRTPKVTDESGGPTFNRHPPTKIPRPAAPPESRTCTGHGKTHPRGNGSSRRTRGSHRCRTTGSSSRAGGPSSDGSSPELGGGSSGSTSNAPLFQRGRGGDECNVLPGGVDTGRFACPLAKHNPNRYIWVDGACTKRFGFLEMKKVK
jgi:hypothetical protein